MKFLKSSGKMVVPKVPARPFRVVGVQYLEIILSTSYYLLMLPHTFRWDSRVGRLKVIESSFRRILYATDQIVMSFGFCGYLLEGLFNLTSNKKDLWKWFATIRNVTSVVGGLIIYYGVIVKRTNFHRFIDAISSNDPYPSEELDKIEKKTFFLRTLAILSSILMFLSATTATPSVWDFGFHNASIILYQGWLNSATQAYPMFRGILMDPTIKIYLGYLGIILNIYSYIFMYLLLILQVTFALFLLANVKNFKTYLSELKENEILFCNDLYGVYLKFKHFHKSMSIYMGPRFLCYVIQTVPFYSYLLSEFSQFVDQNWSELYSMILWTVAISFMYFIAADAASQTGEIKEILVNGKRRFEGMFLEPSEYFAILSDLSEGNELGMSCCRCVVIDYSFVNGMITSIFTFSVILIQAKP